MRKPSRERRRNLMIPALVIALLGVFALSISTLPITRQAHALQMDGDVSPELLGEAMVRAGYDVDALAAAGVTPFQVRDAVDDLHAALAIQPDQLRALDGDYAQARRTADQLSRRIRAGLASQDEIAAYSAAQAALTAAAASREQYVQSLTAAAQARFDLGQRQVLARMAGNKSERAEGTLEFTVKDRPTREWTEIRDAVSDERIASDTGDEADPDLQAYLAVKRADYDVQQAAANHATYVQSINDAWTQAVGL
jgi:hypothetical protein